ncbi:Hypothetical protein Tpal_1108 [Trichococcus palustris]|jgi:hypothetical protein|uniref:Uncharacterized protein n=1 Tax=Trichococcus palustris TaxID=140314 RepID=A0A143YH84_9LACT|nr:hypothetical protein [Trichococcus palustris]CZQ89236.1 Hypothetical protein Tpal_1108 [Trichococcus palustris]SFL11132.1 hypothetical protein SAMN04488076_12022 [Trichococcus palustris]
MEYEFLNNFDERMKRVGAYALLYKNSMQKTTWKKFGFENFDEQTNIIFAVLLYVMEQSLKDEPCTLDDIGSFVDDLNMSYLKKMLTYEECKELADFIINTVLCDDGKAMYFNGYDFSEKEYQAINISFLNNEIIYLEDTVRRTSFKLSNDGYSLLLSTLEMEANMRLTIHEFIFKMHMEKQSYDKAVEDVKNIFNLLRIQLQKMQEAVLRIKQNALSYSVQEYKTLMDENLRSLETTKNKFDSYKNHVRERIAEFEEQDINIKKLDKEEHDNLSYLKTIELYLSRAIEEQQKLLIAHFDLKDVYAKELEDLSQMSLIKRFNIRKDMYDLVFEDAGKLKNIHYFLAPLFKKKVKKTYNINKSLQYQKTIRKKDLEDDEEMLSFDEEEWEAEQLRIRKEKLDKYKHSLQVMLRLANERGGITLHEISAVVSKERDLLEKLIPTVEIFREIVIELLKNKSVDVQELQKEKAQYTDDFAPQFQLNETILSIVEESPELRDITYVTASKLSGKEKVKFRELASKDGMVKVVTCSDILFEVKRGKQHGL